MRRGDGGAEAWFGLVNFQRVKIFAAAFAQQTADDRAIAAIGGAGPVEQRVTVFVGVIVVGEFFAGGILDRQPRVQQEAERKRIDVQPIARAFLGGEGKAIDVAGLVDAAGKCRGCRERLRGGVGVIGLALGQLRPRRHRQSQRAICSIHRYNGFAAGIFVRGGGVVFQVPANQPNAAFRAGCRSVRPSVADPRAVGEGEAINMIRAAAKTRCAIGGKLECGDLQ